MTITVGGSNATAPQLQAIRDDLGLGAAAVTPGIGVTDGDKGHIVVSGTGTAWNLDSSVVTAAALTVLDDTTVAAMVNTLGGATSTGTGGLVRATSPTLVTPVLGTPTSGTLTNCAGLPTSGLVGTVTNSQLGTGIDAAKLADGSVSNAEFQHLNGVTSPIQTQLDSKLASAIATAITATKATPIGADQIIVLDSAASSEPKLSLISSLPAGGAPADGSITLAKLANLAQDQFIGRTTASTGVPQTATITAAARTVLDDATVGDMRTTLSAAARAQTGMVPIFIRTVANETLRLIINAPVALTITNISTRSASGTCTVTGQIDGTPLGGTANSASTTEQSQAHASANTLSAGSDFLLAFTSNSSCTGLAVNVHYTYTQA